MIFEEGAPIVVEEDAISLESVSDAGPAGVFLLEGDGTLKEGEAHEERFPTLPGEGDFGEGI